MEYTEKVTLEEDKESGYAIAKLKHFPNPYVIAREGCFMIQSIDHNRINFPLFSRSHIGKTVKIEYNHYYSIKSFRHRINSLDGIDLTIKDCKSLSRLLNDRYAYATYLKDYSLNDYILFGTFLIQSDGSVSRLYKRCDNFIEKLVLSDLPKVITLKSFNETYHKKFPKDDLPIYMPSTIDTLCTYYEENFSS